MTDTNRIRVLNDLFRKTFIGGRVQLTAGVTALDNDTKTTLLTSVQTFRTFTEDNDPHEEHDFGAVDVNGFRFFWKIDYLDKSLEFGSNDPADPRVTTRVITIMLASEY